MWVGEMLLHRNWAGWREAPERGLGFTPSFWMERVSHFHCKCFLAVCQDYALILPFPTTWLFISLRAPVRCSHLHAMQSRGRVGHSSLVLLALHLELERGTHWHITPQWRWECVDSDPDPCLMRPLAMMCCCLGGCSPAAHGGLCRALL